MKKMMIMMMLMMIMIVVIKYINYLELFSSLHKTSYTSDLIMLSNGIKIKTKKPTIENHFTNITHKTTILNERKYIICMDV